MTSSLITIPILFLGILFCVLPVRSQWLLTQPCNSKNGTLNVGKYTSGLCHLAGDGEQKSICAAGSWTTYDCPHMDSCNHQCDEYESITMNQCINGEYSSCTKDSSPQFKKLGFDAVVVSFYNTAKCLDGPDTLLVVEQGKCFHYTPPGSFNIYKAINYRCSKDGSKALLAIYVTADCSDIGYTLPMATNNCTTDLFTSTPFSVSCVNKSTH